MKDLLIIPWLVVLCSMSATMGQRLTGSESPQPAFLLRPRNFNPHPYESRSYVHHSQDYLYGYPSPFQYYHHLQPVALQSSPDRNPYNAIKEQRGFLSQQTSPQDHQALAALTKHAQKVLKEPEENVNRKYAFEYTANDIYHSQQQDDQGFVKGSYEVPLPDGRVQIVQYTADGNGYHPEISYKGEAATQQQQSSAVYSVPPLQPIPVRQPVQRGSVVVYPEEGEADEEEEERVVNIEPPRSYYTTTTTTNQQPAIQYNNYGVLSGLPAPYGTVRTTAGQVLANAATAAKFTSTGHIQYATYEDVVDSQAPETQLYVQ